MEGKPNLRKQKGRGWGGVVMGTQNESHVMLGGVCVWEETEAEGKQEVRDTHA